MNLSISVRSTLPKLEADLTKIATEAPADLDRATEKAATRGNAWAKADAARKAGRHGVHYPDAFTVEKKGEADYEYGPDSALPQGHMNFELGPGPQSRPHLSVTLSFDQVKVDFPAAVSHEVDGWFW